MNLLDLPSEVLIIICETLPDFRVLLDWTQTCKRAREIFTKNSLIITKHVSYNTYTHFIGMAKDAVDACSSFGELDYVYLDEHRVQWIYPQTHYTVVQPQQFPSSRSPAQLQTLTRFCHDTQNLIQWCTLKCRQKSTWFTPLGRDTRDSVTEALLRLQLVSNRLYNVRLPTFPEHVSLRIYENDTTRTFISRKTRDQAKDLMEDELRGLDINQLRNIWILLQILQDDYLLLRRHRLRPMPGSLLDLLFQHDLIENVWSISPWFAVQNLLSARGLHIVPARPSTAFRFLGHETTHELQQKDVAEFDQYLASIYLTTITPGKQACRPKLDCKTCLKYPTNLNSCPHAYLERFRPLLGLPYRSSTRAADLVRFRSSMQPVIVANCYYAYESTTVADRTPLGKILLECAESNSSITASKRRNSSKAI